jgi:SAM-dependent methyltransferase
VGIWLSMAEAIRKLPLPKGFHVIELGSQVLTWEIKKLSARLLYEEMGCTRYESIDANGAGTIVHDLNLPLPDIGTFDLVTDFGTGEHIFDQAQVWRTVHSLTKVGGYIGVIRPEQGYPGHCFYRTDECLFRDIAAANKYEIVSLYPMRANRGNNIFLFYHRVKSGEFRIPQQGRYSRQLKL